jgi:large subunit ribosomal protein L21e
MVKHRIPRDRGKLSFSRYFQKFKEGDFVAIARELSVIFGYSKRTQGRTGRVLGKRGSAYEVLVKDLNKPKKYLIKPIHLVKIQVQESTK